MFPEYALSINVSSIWSIHSLGGAADQLEFCSAIKREGLTLVSFEGSIQIIIKPSFFVFRQPTFESFHNFSCMLSKLSMKEISVTWWRFGRNLMPEIA